MQVVVFRCDVGPVIGIGHVMRSLALAEELAARGLSITFMCDGASVPWAAEQIRRRGFGLVEPAEGAEQHVRAFKALSASAVVFDSYLLSNRVYRATRQAQIPTLAIVDNELRGAAADLILDANVGAESDVVPLPEPGHRLAGLQYALIRSDVLRLRPLTHPVGFERSVPKVLGVFGGTDPYGAATVVSATLVQTGVPFDATIITRSALVPAVNSIPVRENQVIKAASPTSRLADMVFEADCVISAAGSSTWELLALGAATALVRVAENQSTSYQRLVDGGLVVGLGALADLNADGAEKARASLTEILTDAQRRAQVAASGWSHVDGKGRVRVADALLRLLDRK